MKGLLIISLTLASLIVYINAHGRLADPVNRGSIWRHNPDEERYPWAEDLEWCFDPYLDPVPESDKRNVKCGVCGPVYNNDPKAVYRIIDGEETELYSFERESPLYTGDLQKIYRRGQKIRVKLDVSKIIFLFFFVFLCFCEMITVVELN